MANHIYGLTKNSAIYKIQRLQLNLLQQINDASIYVNNEPLLTHIKNTLRKTKLKYKIRQ